MGTVGESAGSAVLSGRGAHRVHAALVEAGPPLTQDELVRITAAVATAGQ